jgi:hypothetical protein
MKFKNINIYQTWQVAYKAWHATRAEKRSFKEQLLLIQSQTIKTQNTRSNDSYFCQIKSGKRPISQDAETFANQFFSINRKY